MLIRWLITIHQWWRLIEQTPASYPKSLAEVYSSTACVLALPQCISGWKYWHHKEASLPLLSSFQLLVLLFKKPCSLDVPTISFTLISPWYPLWSHWGRCHSGKHRSVSNSAFFTVNQELEAELCPSVVHPPAPRPQPTHFWWGKESICESSFSVPLVGDLSLF